MKITYIANAAEIGGGNRSLLNLASLMESRGHHVEVVVPEKGPLEDMLAAAGIAFTRLSIQQPEISTPFRTIRSQMALVRYFRARQPAIVHANDYWSARAVSIPARLCRIPLIAHFRFRAGASVLKWLWRAMPSPDAFVFNSQAMLNEHAQVIRRICPRSKLTRIYNPIDTSHFSSSPKRKKKSQTLVVGVLANLFREKGQDVLLRAVALLAKEGCTMDIRLAGYDNQNSGFLLELESLAKELGIAAQLTFTGHVSDVPAFLQDIDILACPSRREAFGRSAAEGLACELPVIASRVDGLPEVVLHEVCGLLVPPDDPVALADGLRCLANDPDLRTKFGLAGRQRVQHLFSEADHADAIASLYEEAIVRNSRNALRALP